MIKRIWARLYAVVCVVFLIAGYITVFAFSWRQDTPTLVSVLIGMLLGVLITPVFHELGHVIFGRAVHMRTVYCKFLCFRLTRVGKRLKFGFASPFLPDETQMIPASGGNMKRRACWYTLGGLICSAVFLLVNIVGAIWLPMKHVFRGILPYAAYLFLLNALPTEYATGKTDAAVFRGIRRGEDAELAMISAMEIQGRLFEGNTYGQIDESYYFSSPQLAEDEPLFAVMLDLKYRYCLEKGEIERAADCLNRLVLAQEYLSQPELEKVLAECVYMHANNRDFERAEECGKFCRAYLSQEHATAKRILAAYSHAFGKTDAVSGLKKQAEIALQEEYVQGNAAFERILLSRVPNV